MRAVRDLWFSIREPRVLKTLYAVGYVITTLVGIATLLRPPSSIEGPLGPTLTTAWGLLFLLGSLAALVAVFPGWYWLERVGVYLLAGGAAIYFGVVLVLHVQGPPGSSRLTQAGVILALAWFACVIRLWEIRGFTFEPRGR